MGKPKTAEQLFMLYEKLTTEEQSRFRIKVYGSKDENQKPERVEAPRRPGPLIEHVPGPLK